MIRGVIRDRMAAGRTGAGLDVADLGPSTQPPLPSRAPQLPQRLSLSLVKPVSQAGRWSPGPAAVGGWWRGGLHCRCHTDSPVPRPSAVRSAPSRAESRGSKPGSRQHSSPQAATVLQEASERLHRSDSWEREGAGEGLSDSSVMWEPGAQMPAPASLCSGPGGCCQGPAGP